MSDMKPRTSDQIISKMQSDLDKHRKFAEKTEKKLNDLYASLSEGKEIDLTYEAIQKNIDSLVKMKKKPINLYLTNWAKLNIEDEELFSVAGEFKMWKEKRDKVDVIQKQLLNAATILNNCVKTAIKIRTILKEKGKTNDGKD